MPKLSIISLRPIQRSDLPLLDSWTNDSAAKGAYNSFGFTPTIGFEEQFTKHGYLSDAHGQLLVVVDTDQVVGSVSYWQVRYGPNSASYAYQIGIHLIPEARGYGYGVEAQRQLAAYLFAAYTIVRVEASTDTTNLPEQRALEKAGFTREGIMRQAQWRDGAWHDLVLYSKLRDE